MQKPAPKTLGSVSLTHGFRVSVSPRFLAEQSDVNEPRYVFAYRIRISNESEVRAKLISRRWLITDGNGIQHAVEGEGVVGLQPELAPGEVHIYSSFCPLQTSWGTMEGAYLMETRPTDGSAPRRFEIEVGKFFLMIPE